VRRVVGVLSLVAAYAIAFVVLQPRIGDGVLALTMVPLLVAAWLFGLRGGVVAGVGLVGLDLVLMQTVGGHDGFRPGQLPRILVAIGIGGVVGYVRDLKLDLERRVAERTKELVARNARERELAARTAAADRMAQIGTLTAGIGHQINNPLAAVIANLDEIARRLPTGDPQLAEATRDAQEAAERVAQIARDVRLFTQRGKPTSEVANVRRVIDSTVRMVANEIRQRARLELDIVETPYARIATAELCQVVLNVLVNAFQFLPATGAHAVTVKVQVSPDGTQVILTVSDTGPGIPADDRHRVFDPFFTTKPIGDGTGLGLWVCHQIVTTAGGTIEIDPTTTTGTTVRIALLVGVPSPEHISDQVAPLKKARILVIDDDPIVGRAVEKLVRDRHEVIVVIDPLVALARLEGGERFDVILSDVMMPELDGAELHGKLQTIAPEQAARMIFMSGGAFTSHTKQFFEAPERVRLDKPFTREDLERVLAQILTTP
jgi:signal transduction histidine kinase/CheY-like chemotaxis protein